ADHLGTRATGAAERAARDGNHEGLEREAIVEGSGAIGEDQFGRRLERTPPRAMSLGLDGDRGGVHRGEREGAEEIEWRGGEGDRIALDRRGEGTESESILPSPAAQPAAGADA